MHCRDSKLTVRLTQSGTAEEPIVISAYENEAPIFDFEQQLLDCGIPAEQVQVAGICTYQQCDDFFSARRLSINSGRIFTGFVLG